MGHYRHRWIASSKSAINLIVQDHQPSWALSSLLDHQLKKYHLDKRKSLRPPSQGASFQQKKKLEAVSLRSATLIEEIQSTSSRSAVSMNQRLPTQLALSQPKDRLSASSVLSHVLNPQ